MDCMRDVLERQVARAVREGDLQAGLDGQSSTPSDELFGSCGDWRIKGCHTGHGFRCRKVVALRKARSPIESLRLTLIIYTQHIACIRGVDTKDARVCIISNMRILALRCGCLNAADATEKNQDCRVWERLRRNAGTHFQKNNETGVYKSVLVIERSNLLNFMV